MRAAGWTKGPFLAPEWLSIYAASMCDAHEAERAGEFRLLVAHRDGHLVAALPLVAERRKLAGVPARVLRSLADDHSQRFDLLLDPACADEAARALVAHLSRTRDWDALELQSILNDGAAAHALIAAAIAADLPIGEWASMVSPYLPLPSDDDALDKQQGGKFRGNLRRRAKKLEAEVGAIALERIDGTGLSAVELDALLDEGFAPRSGRLEGRSRHRHRLRSAPQVAATAPSPTPSPRAASWPATSCAPASAASPSTSRSSTPTPTTCSSPASIPRSPATASVTCSSTPSPATSSRRGIRELDFLGDDMPWKRDWTDKMRAHSFRYLFAPTARGRALAAWKLRLAPAAKRLWSRLHRR